MTLDPGHFRDRYAASADPYGLAERWYEARKYALSRRPAAPRSATAPRSSPAARSGCSPRGSRRAATACSPATRSRRGRVGPGAGPPACPGVRVEQRVIPGEWPPRLVRPHRLLRDPLLLRRRRPGPGAPPRPPARCAPAGTCSRCTGGTPRLIIRAPATRCTRSWPRTRAWPGWPATATRTSPPRCTPAPTVTCGPSPRPAGSCDPLRRRHRPRAQRAGPAALLPGQPAPGGAGAARHAGAPGRGGRRLPRPDRPGRAARRRRGRHDRRPQRRRGPGGRACARCCAGPGTWTRRTSGWRPPTPTRSSPPLAAPAGPPRQPGLGRGGRHDPGDRLVRLPAGRPRSLFRERYGARAAARTRHVHGANLGFRASAYLTAGGFPDMPTAEDHALVAALTATGSRVLRTRALHRRSPRPGATPAPRTASATTSRSSRPRRDRAVCPPGPGSGSLMRLMRYLERATRLDRLIEACQRAARLLPPGQRDALHGVWLGHPLHPVLAGPGALSLAFADAWPGNTSRRLVLAGLAASVPAMLAGTADWSELHEQQMPSASVHAAANTAAIALYAASAAIPARGRALRLAGLAAAGAGSWRPPRLPPVRRRQPGRTSAAPRRARLARPTARRAGRPTAG